MMQAEKYENILLLLALLLSYDTIYHKNMLIEKQELIINTTAKNIFEQYACSG